MFNLKEFVATILIAVLCLFLKTAPVFAANATDAFIPPENSTVEFFSVGETEDNSIHAPPEIIFEETYSINEDFGVFSPKITLTMENDIVVETFHPAEYDSKNDTSSIEDIPLMIPLVTQDNLNDNGQEVVLALAVSSVDFPNYPHNENIGQIGLVLFF